MFFLSNVRCCMICHVRRLASYYVSRRKCGKGGICMITVRAYITFCLLCDPMGKDVQQKKKQQLTEIMSLFLSWMQDLADESRHYRMIKLLVDSKIKIHNRIMAFWQASIYVVNCSSSSSSRTRIRCCMQ